MDKVGRARLLLRLAPLTAAPLLAVLATTAAPAHHSYSMFDRSRRVTVVGTVQQFKMVNPHSWLDIVSVDSKGVQKKWSFEGGSYGQMIRRGVRPSTFKVGKKITVEAFPLRDGRPGGHVVKATTAEGQVIEMVPGGEQ